MNKIFVSGLINQEVNVKVEKFPIEYCPVLFSFFGIDTSISGVGYNIAKSLRTLGNEVELLSVIGNDDIGDLIINEIKSFKINEQFIIRKLKKTSESVILVDKSGKRHIYCDLKDINNIIIDEDTFIKASEEADILCLCNINFNRSFLELAKSMNKIIATDVHIIKDVYDDYNKDFMKVANILFMSDEYIKDNLESFIDDIIKEYDNDIIVVGRGSLGSYMYTKKDNFRGYFPAVKTREVVNTIGAGDALFSSFIHIYSKTNNPYIAMKMANIFASYKIGENGAAKGFLTTQELENLYLKIINN